MTDPINTETFEMLIHLLELSVVLGIASIVYITKKYSKKINDRYEGVIDGEVDTISEE